MHSFKMSQLHTVQLCMAIMFLCILVHSVKCISFPESIVQGVWIVKYTGHVICVSVYGQSQKLAEAGYFQLSDSGGTVDEEGLMSSIPILM